MTTNATSAVDSKLKALASKQHEWNKEVSPAEKLEYIENAIDMLCKEVGTKELQVLGEGIADMKGIMTGKEREYIISEEVMIMAVGLKGYLDSLREAYTVRAGKNKVSDVPTRKVEDYIVADVFPLFDSEKAGPLQNWKGENWFDKEHIKDPSQVKPYKFDFFDNQQQDGVMVVLGAGNYTVLTMADMLYALFVKNQVVFVKHHPLRTPLDGLMRKIFYPLYTKGYLDSEPDHGIEHSSQIINSPYVSALHLTGGKATHDAIVWGSTKDEQEQNKAKGTPKLKNASVTSELGCVTPYIITPAQYTDQELEHQAQVISSAKWINGGASCNAPQVCVVAETWPHREEFVSLLSKSWEMTHTARTYYPGVANRWKSFQDAYPSAKIVYGKPCSEDEKKNDEHLPLLLVDIDVDLSNDIGRQKAMAEHAFKNEAFAPVLIIATVRDNGMDDFITKAVDLGNNYMFGSLSCSMAVPPSADGNKHVEKAIADLKYGTVALNAWSANAYFLWSLAWGAYPGDKLEATESGIGKVCNALVLPHIAKSVCRTPIVDEQGHFTFQKSLDDIIAGNLGFAQMVLGE